MDKVWLAQYPPGMPIEIDCSAYHSVAEMLEEAMKRHVKRLAFTCMGKSITYGELDRMSNQVGAWLQSRGLTPGCRVAIMMPNVLQYPVCLIAILRAGYVAVTINPLYTPRELEHQLKDSGAEAIFIIENFATTLEKIVAHTGLRHIVVASMGDLLGGFKGRLVNFVARRVRKMVPKWKLPGAVRFNNVLAVSSRMKLEPQSIAPDDVAFLQYTGGTTGVSKGATLLHRNMMANMVQLGAWVQPAIASRNGAPLTFICALPLYHIFALTFCHMVGMRIGACNILIPNARDIPGLVKELAKVRFNCIPAVNTLFNALAHNTEFSRLDFSSLTMSIGGGMAVQKAVAEKWKAVTGCPIIEGYGLSETSPVATCNSPLATEYNGSIGLPLPSTEIAIRDDNGVDVPIGHPGEICIRGPQVMAGYWQRADETARVMTEDGFFKSGDIGIMDPLGFTRIVDRKKDMILISGFNVYPNEVEDVAVLHPGVLEAAAVGVPDAHSGEAVTLFVVRTDPTLTQEALHAFLKERLTGYKRPKRIEFRVELPKTPVGKILRRNLRPVELNA